MANYLGVWNQVAQLILPTLHHAGGVTVSIASRLLRPVCRLLMDPSIRYAYLPALRPLVALDRKEEMLHTCFQYLEVADVHGDYLEFGLWKGANLVRAYHLSRRFTACANMKFVGFDSFMGIPELTTNRGEAKQFPPGAFLGTYEEVRETLRRSNVPSDKVALVKGWFSDTLTPETRRHLNVTTVAVAYIDCDVYESTVPVLEFLGPCLAEGTILAFDDWYCFKNDKDRGQQKAFREWLEQNPQWTATPFKEFGCDGKSFIMNRARVSDMGMPAWYNTAV